MTGERWKAGTDSHPPEQEPREIRRLGLEIEFGRHVLAGEAVFGDVICENLEGYVADARQKGIDIGALEPEINDLLRKLPVASVNNCLDKAEQFMTAGEQGLAKEWLDAADRNIHEYRHKLRLSEEDASTSLERLKTLKNRLAPSQH